MKHYVCILCLIWLAVLGIQGPVGAQVVIEVRPVASRGENTGTQGTLTSLPPYEMQATLHNPGNKALGPLTLRFDPLVDSPDSLAQRLLARMAQHVNTQPEAIRTQLKGNPEYAFLFNGDAPQRTAFLVSAAQQIKRLFPVPGPLPPPTGGAEPGVLYATERLIAGATPPRLLRLIIRDRGAHAPALGQRRYLLCVSYNTRQGEFTGPAATDGCPAEGQRVTTRVELEGLGARELFVGQVMAALDTTNLFQVDGAGASAYRNLEAWRADLAQKRTDAAAAASAARAAAAAYAVAAARVAAPNELTALQAAQTRANNQQTAASDRELQAATAVATAQRSTRAAIKAAVADHDLLGLDKAEQTAVQGVLTDIFIDYVKQQTASTLAPRAGVVELSSRVAVHRQDGEPPYTTFYPDSVQLVVEDGNVEELKVSGRLADGQPLLFETYAPVGMSSDRDLRQTWPRQRLWSQTAPALANDRVRIQLTDLLRYTPNVDANGKDRSPADGTYVLRPTDGLARRTLPRLATTKILQARVYSDVAGLSGYKPNGLLQIEVDRKLEWGTPWSKQWRLVQFRAPGYFLPLVAATKIEQNNRYLPLERVAGPALLYRVNTIDLLRYANLRVGGDINLAGLRLAAIKSDLFLDASVYLNRVDIRDSVRRPNTNRLVRVDSTLNVAMYGIGLKTRFRPDSRYGVQSRIGFYRYALLNDYDQHHQLLIQQTPNIAGLNPDAHTQLDKYIYQGVLQYELLAWANLSENSRLFFRTQFSHLLYQSNHTYFQLQLGYQFDVFTTTRDNKDKVKTLF